VLKSIKAYDLADMAGGSGQPALVRLVCAQTGWRAHGQMARSSKTSRSPIKTSGRPACRSALDIRQCMVHHSSEAGQ
jgi:hypothetical protein